MPPNRNTTPTPPAGGHQPSFTPQAPHYDYNSAPQVPQFQQHQNGAYEVVPSLPTVNNTGHTGHNPYEFIVNPNTPKRSSNIFGGIMSSWKGLAVAGVGVVIIVFIIGIVMSSLAPEGSTPGLTAAAQRQQEIVRIATAANLNATSPDVRNFAVTVATTIQSNQVQTTAYLASHGTKLNDKLLALDQSAQTDTLLANAATAGNYDTTVTQNLTSQLQTYQGILTSTFKQTNNTAAKALLQADYSTAQKLLTQAKSVSTTD
jgi:flagellar basal body-associated protein FliL